MFFKRADRYFVGGDGNVKGRGYAYCGCSESKGNYYYNIHNGLSHSVTKTGNMLIDEGIENIGEVREVTDLTWRQETEIKRNLRESVTNTTLSHTISIIDFEDDDTIRKFIGKKGLRVNLISVYLSLKYNGVIICTLSQGSSENTVLIAINKQSEEYTMDNVINSICDILKEIENIYEHEDDDVEAIKMCSINQKIRMYLINNIYIEISNNSPLPACRTPPIDEHALSNYPTPERGTWGESFKDSIPRDGYKCFSGFSGSGGFDKVFGGSGGSGGFGGFGGFSDVFSRKYPTFDT